MKHDFAPVKQPPIHIEGVFIMPVFQFTVDGESFSTSEHTLTPRQILQIAGLDPNNYYLIEIHGNHQDPYKDKPDQTIHMNQHDKFVTVFMGQTPVSLDN
jgi:hypothetical protein